MMEITKIGKALSNETRIKILSLISRDDRSSIETYREYRNEFADDKHRETIYRQLEHLVEVNLVEKYYDDEDQQLKYSLCCRKLLVDLNIGEVEVVDGSE